VLGVLALALVASCGSNGGETALGDAAVTVAASPTATAPTSAPSSPAGDDGSDDGTDDGDDRADAAIRAAVVSGRTVDTDADVEVEDQQGDGRSVRIERAVVGRGSGHVAIFATDGTLLGSAEVTRTVSPVTVRLDTPITASGEFVAVLFADDGDGVLDLAVDEPVNDGGDDADDRLELEDEDFTYVLQ
jgi:hypothetical protein